jgi:hypothetical protein
MSCPLLFYSTQLYPDLPAGVCLALAARVSLADPGRPPPRAAVTAGAAAGLALLPLLGVKFLPPALVLGAGGAARLLLGGRRAAAGALAMGLLLGAGAFFALIHWQYGSLSPQAAFSGMAVHQDGGLLGRLSQGLAPRLLALPWWLFGYLADGRAGLLLLAPLYALGFAGLARLPWRRAGIAAGAAALYLCIYAYHLDWGGYCPPGRPLVAVLWGGIALAALGLQCVPRALSAALAGASMLVSAAYVFRPERLYVHLHPNAQADPSPLLADLSLPSVDLTRLAPFVSMDHLGTAANVAWAGLLAAAALALLWLGRRRAGPARNQGPSAAEVAAALLVTAGLFVWCALLDPTRAALPVPTGLAQGQIWIEAGAEWSDGWLEGGRTTRLWLRLDRSARLVVRTLAPTAVHVEGQGLRRVLRLTGMTEAEIRLPDSWIGSMRRIALRPETRVVPADVSGSGDRRPLGCRVLLLPLP